MKKYQKLFVDVILYIRLKNFEHQMWFIQKLTLVEITFWIIRTTHTLLKIKRKKTNKTKYLVIL